AYANGITDVNHVEAGRVLSVPGAGAGAPSGGGGGAQGSYTVKQGDSLASIAVRHGTTISALVKANNIKNPNVVVIGRTLTVPEDNIRMSARLLHTLLDQSGGDVRRAVASYYQGPTSVRMIGLLPETQDYVSAVLAFRASFK